MRHQDQHPSISPVLGTSSFSSLNVGDLLKSYNTLEGWMTIGLLVFLILLSKILGRGQGKISTGRMAASAEKLAATRLALQQVRNIQRLQDYNQAQALGQPIAQPIEKKTPRHNQVALWCGMPRYWVKNDRWKGLATTLQTMLGSPPTLFLPDAQRSALVLGIPGSGKTFSVIDRTVESALAQGIPIILYDKKGDQMRLHAPLAARYGYKVHVFAPGEPFSGVLNPLDFLRDSLDSVMAGELAAVVNRNASKGGKSDEFFSKAGDQLSKGLIQLAKSTQYADMAMVYAILKLPDLVERLSYGIERGTINPWIASSLSQFVGSKEAEKTVAGIQTTASATFSGFIQADLLPAFMGQSNIPSRISGKQMIIFKLDDERRSIVGPLLAAALHLSIVSNLSTLRQDPIAIFLDELPSLRLERLPQWINEYRSNGGCFVLGAQSLNQLYEAYGEKMGGATLAVSAKQRAAACSTHILFNPGDSKTAEEYSKRFGDKEVKLRNRSTSNSMGQSSSRSTSWNESLQKLPLFTVDQILRLPEGRCILSNPGYRSGAEGSVPYALKVPVPLGDIKRGKESEALWQSHVRSALQARVVPLDSELLTQELQARIQLAEELLPMPQKKESSAEEEMPVVAAAQTSEEQPKNFYHYARSFVPESPS
jgi:type IV secretion system protein VirD4